MASLDPLHPLQSAVVELLALEGGMSVAALRIALKDVHGITVSQPHLYRLLADLHREQVIVRVRGSVSLNSVWISHLIHFAEQARERSASSSDASLDFAGLRDGEVRSFYADSLEKLDPVWNHAIVALTKLAETQDWYIYNSHPWYSLGMRETETRLYRGLIAEGITFHMLYGNDTFLDRYGQKLIRMNGFHSACANGVPFLPEGHALWSCGSYLIECVFPDAVSKHFAFFFRSVERIEEFDPALFADVFRMRARCKVTVRRRAEEAEKVRGMLRGYF
jgi:hypothetical protein